MLLQGAWSLNRFAFYFSLLLVLCSLSGSVAAIGLGELRGHPALGERPRFEIELLGADKQTFDASCFRLVQPAVAGDLPWLKKASINLRKSTPPVLEIYSEVPLREPILQLAVQMTCGVEVSREYLLLVSPRKDVASPVVEAPLARQAPQSLKAQIPRLVGRQRVPNESSDRTPSRSTVKKAVKRAKSVPLPDRLMLSGGVEGEPSLRLATELFSGGGIRAEAKEAQREILRLEYRMLLTLHEQVTTQMATAEKLRNMEDMLGELQQRTAEFGQRVESNNSEINTPVAATSTLAEPRQTSPAASLPIEQPRSVLPPPVVEPASGLSEWSLYGLLLGALLGLGGWLGWRNYRERQQRLVEDEYLTETSEIEVDPQRDDEPTPPEVVDLHIEPSASEMPHPVDVELDSVESAPAAPLDSVFSISAATLDEHFEANPVMELADIMLSFGRVKGAAQALQEYIDNNPQEALQPWIRLMDVYRMAGMKDEFQTVATNLNRNFNVEIQQWDLASPLGEHVLDLVLDDALPPQPVAPRAESLEDMPRIMSMVCELWPTGDVVGYLYQLLRDNRGGQRIGFALPVVEEILFLVELKETSNRID